MILLLFSAMGFPSEEEDVMMDGWTNEHSSHPFVGGLLFFPRPITDAVIFPSPLVPPLLCLVVLWLQ